MQSRNLTLGDAWRTFKRQSLATQIYIICFVLIFASGQTFLHGYVSQIMIVMLAAGAFTVLERRRRHREKAIQPVGFFPLVSVILLLIALLSFLQMNFAFIPSIAKTYSIRYAIFAALTLFIVSPEVLGTCMRLVSSYLNVGAVVLIASTAILGTKTGGLLGDYQAGGMMMSIACILNIIDYYRSDHKSTHLLLTLLTAVALLLTGKRAFALIVFAAVFVVYLFASKDKKSLFRVLLMVALIAFVGFAAYSFTDIGKSGLERFLLLTGDDKFVAMSGRNLLWNAAWTTFIEHPQLGIGFGSFEKWYAVYYSANRGAAYLPHNIYYGMLAETGIVGTTLFILMFVWGIISTLRVLIKARKKNLDVGFDYVLVTSLALQLWFVVYGLTGNGIYDANEMFFYVAALVMSLSVRKVLKGEVDLKTLNKKEDGISG